MAKNKGKRRSKAAQNRQGSPSKNASSATTREHSPEASEINEVPDETASMSHDPGPTPEAPSPDAGMIRKVSSRVAQFEEAARAGSLLNHERDVRDEPRLRSPLRIAENGKMDRSEPDAHIDAEIGVPHPQNTPPKETSVAAHGTDFEEVSQPRETAESPLRGKHNEHSPTSEPTQTEKLAEQSPDEQVSQEDDKIIQEPTVEPTVEPIAEPQIPQRSIARSVEPDTVQTFEAKRQPVMIARPVMLESIDDSRDQMDSDVDLDSYFDSPDDVVVTAATVRKIDSPETSHSPLFSGNEFDMDSVPESLPSGSGSDHVLDSAADPAPTRAPAVPETPMPREDAHVTPTEAATSNGGSGGGGLRVPKLRAPGNGAQHFIRRPEDRISRASSGRKVSERDAPVALAPSLNSSPSIRRVSSIQDDTAAQSMYEENQNPEPSTAGQATPRLAESVYLPDNLNDLPPPRSLSPQSSPNASPRAYKYEQSPLPKLEESKTEPPIIGVCVVGFHHQRGPEVEYWVGPDESQSTMWPYLPFQSLPDGSHQFEENVTYFMLLYDRNRHAATSLTFDRDEDGHIKQGTTDFRNVTTLFAIACSRQIPASDLKLSEDEQYTRSTVQKSVVVIASKPLFGPIKEKLTVVTRSYFAQQNFGDRSIIDHFYHNLVQMPLWTNENDLHVGMNLQKCIHDFGAQALVIFKAMLLETKILFYASDTDVLGTTQFALVSLIPNLINHLEDSGSPLLSSYELELQRPTHVSSSDRQSLLKYFGLPLQLFAGGGVFSPFVPLQQFDDLKQPETQYGMMGTTNKLFLGTEIDFDVVVNVDSSEVAVRNPDIAASLQLTESDKLFINNVQKAVNTAWDTNDSWQPQALGYYGGEDYIRHEFEEYLMALLASAKYEQFGKPEQSSSSPLQSYGAAWSERWMRTNNFRISNRITDKRLFDLVEPLHPGVKLQKPSGFERFFGIFKSSNNKATEPPKSSSASVTSQSSSVPRTPTIASGERFGDQPTPATPSTPRRWFWQSESRERVDETKTDAARTDAAMKADAIKPAGAESLP